MSLASIGCEPDKQIATREYSTRMVSTYSLHQMALCWWDRHSFDGAVHRVPVRRGGKIQGHGEFCSPACALAYMDDRKTEPVFAESLASYRLHIYLRNNKRISTCEPLEKAPHFTTIGSQYKNIESFRKALAKYESNVRFLYVLPYYVDHATDHNVSGPQTSRGPAVRPLCHSTTSISRAAEIVKKRACDIDISSYLTHIKR